MTSHSFKPLWRTVECPKRQPSEPIAHALFPPGTSAGSYDPNELGTMEQGRKQGLICALFSHIPSPVHACLSFILVPPFGSFLAQIAGFFGVLQRPQAFF